MTGDLPADTIWTLTGNNVSYVGDMVRRVLPVRLMSQHERPEDRTDFAQRDLLSYVTAIRAGLVVRVVRVMQAYLQAGRPIQPGSQWGGFSQWYDLIRGCVVWCGLDDPMTTRETAMESDASTDAVALLHEAIHEAMKDGYTYGVSASQLVLMAEMVTSDGAPRYPAIYEAVAMLCGGRPNSKSLGRQIQQYKNRWLGQRSIVIEKDGHTKSNLIRLRGVDVSSVIESEAF
jgi:DNA polymerase-1